MVVGTYRPAELIASGHPLRAVKQELLAKQQCEELALDYLTENAVAQCTIAASEIGPVKCGTRPT